MPIGNTGLPWFDQFVNGRNPYGRVGFSLAEMPYARDQQSRAGDENARADPEYDRLRAQYGQYLTGNPNVGQDGLINRNGQQFIQINPNMANAVRDGNLVEYDDEYGVITPVSNYHSDQMEDSGWDRWAPIAVSSLMGMGLAQAGAFGSGAQSMFGGGEQGVFDPSAYGPALGDGGGAFASGEGAFTGGGLFDPSGYGPALGDGGGSFGSGMEAAGGLGNFDPSGYGPAIGDGGGSFASGSPGLLGSLGQGASGLLAQALKNPLGLLGLGQSLSGLLGGGGGGGGGGGSPGGSGEGKGGGGQPATRTPFQRNQATASQLQNHQWVQPRSYR